MDAELVPTGQSSLESLEAHALEAMIAVENVTTPDQADELLRKITAYQQAVKLAKYGQEQERRWARIKLEAERKMGELLGRAEVGAPIGNTNNKLGNNQYKKVDSGDPLEDNVSATNIERERFARVRARKVAAVPEPIFREYLDEAEAPTRAGLLRIAKRVSASDADSAESPSEKSQYTFVTEVSFQHDAVDQQTAEEWTQRLIERVSRAGGVCTRNSVRAI